MTVRVRVRVKMRVRHGVMRRLAAGRSASAARRLAGRLLRRPVGPECGLPPAGFATARRPAADGAEVLDCALGILGALLNINPKKNPHGSARVVCTLMHLAHCALGFLGSC